MMPSISLDTADAIELTELLQLLDHWLMSDRDQLGGSLARLVGERTWSPDGHRAATRPRTAYQAAGMR